MPQPRGPYRTGVKRRAQIIDAASAAFARRGYGKASLREIAEAVGVTPAGILRHFSSKEELLICVLENWDAETTALRVRTAMGEGLDHFLVFPELMRYHMQHPGLIELFLTLCIEASDPDHPAREWVSARYTRIVADGVEHLHLAAREGLARPMGDAEAENEIRSLYAAMDGLELQWISDSRVDLASQFETMFAITLQRWGVALDNLPRPLGATEKVSTGPQ